MQENNQKAGRGLSPPLSTPKIAVESGNSPMKTIEWAAVTCVSAKAVSSGKPTTTPSATTINCAKSFLVGLSSLAARSIPSPKVPAIAARAAVRNSGSKSATATRVAGNEPLKMITPSNPLMKPLDVLVQHLVTCAIGEPFRAADMVREIRSSHAYRDLTDAEWEWALGFITNGGGALASYPRYRKARVEDGRHVVDDKRLIQQHRFSIGTITSDPAVSVRYANGRTLGTVEESFVSKLKPGSLLVFGGRHLVLVRLHQRVATVKPAPKGKKGHVAIWGGSKMPLSSELAHAVALRLCGDGKPCAEMKAVAPILAIQRKWSRVPDDRTLLIEHARSREGEHLFVYPLAGRLVHEGLAALMAFRISRVSNESIQTTQNDYGFSLTARRGLFLGEEEIRSALSGELLLDDLVECMNTAELARRQFREIARVSGLILNPPPGRPARSMREVQSSASLLYEVLHRYDPENLLLHQSRREILERQLELTRLSKAVNDLATRPLHFVETEHLTPMAFPLWADRLSALLPAGDAASRLESMLAELNHAAG